jgi:protein-tyrosine phosphatase
MRINSGVNQIRKDFWLGNFYEGRDFGLILDQQIRALVDLAAEEPPCQPPRELIYCRIPLLDGADNSTDLLSLAVRTVAALLRSKVSTLVSCGAGMSRSPAITAAALAIVEGCAPEESLKEVVAHHHTDVSPGLWEEIIAILPAMRSGA